MNRFYSVSLVVCLFLVLFASGAVLAREESPGNTIDARKAYELIKKDPAGVYVLDVRTPAEFKEGHLPGAHNIDFWGPTFESDIEKLPKDRKILFYCRTGKRSAGAQELLKKEGYDNLLHMHNGIIEWEKEGLPLEKGTKR